MNTKQLIATWYTAITVLWLIAAGSLIRNEWIVLVIVATIIGALSIFTLWNKNELDKKLFFRWLAPGIAAPIIVTAALIIDARVSEEVLPDAEKAKVQIEMAPKHYDDGEIFAEIYNGSSYRITSAIIEITASRLDFSSLAKPEKPISADEFLDSNDIKFKRTRENVMWIRQYQDGVLVSPLSTGLFHVKASDSKDANLSFRVIDVRGVKYK